MIKNKDTITISVASLFNENCEQVSHFFLIVGFEQPTFAGFVLKRQTLLKTRSGLSCIML